ncbi:MULTISPECIES: glycosyl hydrolase family 18 protein [unclassified Pseudoalteromonas]|uniref:glycosyl hydrolase family 18 protein n=1 Tax=unclassified Pseudoalteromonas TaxID=194690 RepID=UPI0016011A85|nr:MULTISPECIES: glycosyl hydrolase family 18 protein [unclassified Pseudoalteromonas]MBB1334302.1 chitinase [Pseudoalteromonas sp. SR41-6]MBB1459861.1 chitinase [Pseudoalteromonas sp. SG41-8]
MNIKQLTAAIGVALFASTAFAAPSTPSINWEPQQYSFVEVNLEGNGSYKQLVTRVEQVSINIQWSAWSGDGGDSYKVYFDDMLVNKGTLSAGSKSGTISFPYDKAGRHTLYVELCEVGTTCARSAGKPIVIADTDGGHLAPLPMDVDPNNRDIGTKAGLVTGAYFVEWGIYGRDYDVTNIPAQNLSHILYGFIPICGENASLTGSPKQALETACAGSADYEVVIHDPWAAVQKALPGVDAADPIRGTYSQLMALKQRYPDLKILPSVGGWTLSDPFGGFTNKANRDTFVASMEEFLRTWKFYDGVDIDWEFPGGDGANPDIGDPINDGPAYVALMQELRAMLDKLEAETGRTYELTSAIGAGYDKIEDVDYQAASQYMDYIFAMTYDFYGAWSGVTGHQTALYCGEHMSVGQCNGTGVDENGEPRKGPAYTTDNAVQLLLAQNVNSKKIVVGTAMYGRGWEGVYPTGTTIDGNPMTATGSGPLKGSTAQGVWEDGVIDYKGIKTHMIGAAGTGVNGFEVGYDDQAQAAYVWNRATGKLITYDSRESVIAKGAYVNQYNLGGLFAWEIDADNGDILNAMHDGLGGVVTPPSNKKPVLSVSSTVTVNAGESVSVSASATDADNDPLTFSWTASPELTVSGSATSTLAITAPNVTQDSQFTATVSVTDGKATVSQSVLVNVIAPTTGDNTAPTVDAIADITIEEGASAAVTVVASDPQNDALTYTWYVPAGLTLVGSGASVNLTAGAVAADTNLTVSVAVSDGQVATTQSFTVTVTNTDTTPPTGDTWDASKVYVGGDTVVYNGVTYKAKWWTQGDRPDLGGVWEAITQPTDDTGALIWQSSATYNSGDQVSYGGNKYQAKWWTQGNEPGVADVWKLL